jgi:hypothetical protein
MSNASAAAIAIALELAAFVNERLARVEPEFRNVGAAMLLGPFIGTAVALAAKIDGCPDDGQRAQRACKVLSDELAKLFPAIGLGKVMKMPATDRN